jgi:hypothetical protein
MSLFGKVELERLNSIDDILNEYTKVLLDDGDITLEQEQQLNLILVIIFKKSSRFVEISTRADQTTQTTKSRYYQRL